MTNLFYYNSDYIKVSDSFWDQLIDYIQKSDNVITCVTDPYNDNHTLYHCFSVFAPSVSTFIGLTCSGDIPEDDDLSF